MNDIKVFGKRNKNETYVDRIGAYIIAEKDGCFAAVETPRGFFLIGGGIENNERHIDCIKRECLEETGRNVQIDGYLCSAEIFTVHDRLGPFHPVQYYYYGKLSDIVAVPVESDHNLRWLSYPDDCGKLFVPAQRWAAQKYFEDIIFQKST